MHASDMYNAQKHAEADFVAEFGCIYHIFIHQICWSKEFKHIAQTHSRIIHNINGFAPFVVANKIKG